MKYTMILLLALIISPVAVFPADTLGIRDIIPMVVENDLNVLVAGRSLSTTVSSSEVLRAGIRPQLTLGQAPSYGYSSAKTGGGLLGPVETRETQSVGVGVSVFQALPTDGSLSASLGTSTVITKVGDTTEITQSPSISLNFSQPVFTNGKIVDLSIYRSRLDLYGRIPVSKAEAQELAVRNNSILGAISGFISVFTLRRQLSDTDENVGISARRVELARLQAEQGSITSLALLEQELALEQLREQRLELKYALLQAEQTLGRSMGGVDIGRTNLSDELPAIDLELSREELSNRAVEANFEIRGKLLSVDEARINESLSGRQFSSDLTLSLRLAPRYAMDRDANDDLGSSVSDLFAEDAYIDPTLSIGLSIPVYDGGKAKYQRRIDENSRVIAEADLAATRGKVMDSMDNLFLRREMLMEKLGLVRENLRYENDRLADKERLYALKKTTLLELDLVRMTARIKELEVWRTMSDLLINALQIFSTAGVDLQILLEG